MRATIPIALALAFGAAAPAAAQDGGAYVSPYLGYYGFDESSFEDALEDLDIEESPIVGVRLGWSSGSWGIEAAYGRAAFDADFIIEGDIRDRRDTTIHLIYGALTWGFPLGALEPFVSGGLGAAKYAPDGHEGATDVVASFGGGVRLDLGERLALRVDAKDHVDLCEAPDFAAGEGTDEVGACWDDETLHNIEFSGGVEIGL